MPIWKGLKKKLNNTRINKHTLLFKEIDGENEEGKISDFEDEYKKKIDGFPTIMIVKDEQVVDFEAEVNTDNLTEFINSRSLIYFKITSHIFLLQKLISSFHYFY